MVAKSGTFGKRAAPQTRPHAVARAAAAPVTTQAAPAEQARPGFIARLPWLTFVLCGTLIFKFISELRAATDYYAPYSPGYFSLLALGASSRKLIVGQGEWWRLFTAPLLHGSPEHLVGNLIALLVAGAILEPLVGIGWFGAIYFIGGLSGELFSVMMNPADMPSVGASGAIMCCLSCLFAFSFHHGVRWPMLMRVVGGVLLFPALISSVSHGAVKDINAHMGGLLAGMALALTLLALWNEDSPEVPGRNAAALVAGGFVVMTVMAFTTSWKSYDSYASQAANFIPQSQLQDAATHFTDDATSDRLAKYPEDPRSHLFRAVFDLMAHNLDAAETQTQQAVQLSALHPGVLPDSVLRAVRVPLALDMAEVRGADQGRRIAAPLCNDSQLEPKYQKSLAAASLCGAVR